MASSQEFNFDIGKLVYIIDTRRRLPLKISQRRAILVGWLLHQNYARASVRFRLSFRVSF